MLHTIDSIIMAAEHIGHRSVFLRWLTSVVSARSAVFDLVAACLAGVMFGIASLVLSPQLVLLGLVICVGVLIAIRRPAIALLGVLFVTSTILDKEFTSLPGIRSLRIVDFLYVALLGLILFRWLAERDFKLITTPLDAPLLALWGVAALSTVLGLLNSGVADWAAFDEMRTISYYLTFFVVTNLVRTQRQAVVLVRGLFLLAVFVSIAMAVQYVLGPSFVILAGRVEELGTQYTLYSDITRMLPPGESVLLVAFLALTAIMVLDRPVTIRSFRAIAWLLTGVAVLLTFNRNFWFSVALGLFMLGIVLTGEERRQYIRWIVAVGVAFSIGATAFVAVAPGTRVARLITASVYRFTTLANVGNYTEDRSLQDRLPEYEYTIPQIVSHPVLGIGMGASYRPYDSRLDWPGHNLQRYTHNAHIWLIMKTGLIGYLCMVWLSVVFVARVFKHWRHISNLELRGAVLSFAITYIGVLAASLVNPIFMQYYWAPVIGLMMGVSELAIRDSMASMATQVGGSNVA